MKRLVCTLLILVLAASLTACGLGSDIMEPVTFYYCRNAYVYGSADGVITSEVREASGHENDLKYLLAMYLRGPLDPTLEAPFPTSCMLLDVTEEGDTLTVKLNSTFTTLSGIDLTVSSACIAKTCFSLTPAQNVRIISAAPDPANSIDITIGIESIMDEGSALTDQAATEASK